MQYLVVYRGEKGADVAYTTAYGPEQSKAAQADCARRHGVFRNVRIVKADDFKTEAAT